MLFEEGIYKYKGYPVSPKIVVEIIFTLYKNNNRRLSRQEIVNSVFNFHIKNEGESGENNKIHQVKKALSDINDLYYKKVRTGFYEFLIVEETKFENFYHPKRSNGLKDDKVINKLDLVSIKEGWVYFYYFPTYKNYAILKNQDLFPIKIGKTRSDPKFRVNEQTGTALPENPVIFLQIKNSDCSNLEKSLHSTLSLLGAKSEYSVGNEWYISNEKKILDLLNNLNNLGVDFEIYKNENLNEMDNF